MADRGLEELAEAMLEPGLEDVHLVVPRLRAAQRAEAVPMPPAPAGSTSCRPCRPTSCRWVAAADVGVMPNQPRTLNERLSTPNKLFESLAVGLPGRLERLPGAPSDRASTIRTGRSARSATRPTPRSIARGDPLDPRPRCAAARADLRARCLRAAHERWNWETESAKLVDLYRELGPTA